MPKPGLMVAIGMPKRGGEDDDIGSPDELDSAPEPKSKMPMHEAAEAPAEEGAEDYGARLVSDIEAVGQKHGMEPEAARMVLGDMLAAVAKCLRGESGEEEPQMKDSTAHVPYGSFSQEHRGAGGYE